MHRGYVGRASMMLLGVLGLSTVSSNSQAGLSDTPLGVEGMTVTSPGPLRAGENINVKFDILNETQAPTVANVLTEFHLCRGIPLVCEPAVMAAPVPSPGRLGPGQRVTVNATLKHQGPYVVRPTFVRVQAYLEGKKAFADTNEVAMAEVPVEPTKGSPELEVTDLRYEGDFNPGGRISITATVAATSETPRPKNVADIEFFWCREQKASTCTSIFKNTASYVVGGRTDRATWWTRLPLELGKGPRFLRVLYSTPGDFDHTNNEKYIPVSTGAPGKYVAFPGMEIDGKNKRELKKVSLKECQIACSTETKFICRSIDYTDKEDRCMLQEVNRATAKLTKSPNKKWTHYARPCQYSDSLTECRD